MYLSRQQIADEPGEKKTHFLNPQSQRLNISLGDLVGLKSLGVHIITVEPGHFTTEHHFHHIDEEAIYVLSGTGIATIGDEEIHISKGDFLGFPTNGIAHSIFVTGSEALQCLVIGNKTTTDICDYPRQGKRLYRHNGKWDLVDLDAVTKVK